MFKAVSKPVSKSRRKADDRIAHKSMHKLVDAVFEKQLESGRSIPEFARTAGLCATTIYNLSRYRTRYPRYSTIFKMAQAAGMQIEMRAISTPSQQQRHKPRDVIRLKKGAW